MINKHNLLYRGVLWAGLTLLSLTIISCSGNSLDKLALGISKMSQLRSAELKGGKFILRVYYRFDQPGAPLHVYLEGDGRAWLTRYRASHNPTPRNPVGLSLAARDYADNVMYIARPCQYVSIDKNPDCKYPYWTHKRFAPEVIDSVSAVIELGKKKAKARELQITGFSGGGAVAILVAAQRDDVTEIRTVAGNLDHKVWTKYQNVDPLKGSLNAVDVAHKVADIPQIHFVGGLDKNIELLVALSFKEKSGPKACLKVIEISVASHSKGWTNLWVKLNKIKLPDCG